MFFLGGTMDFIGIDDKKLLFDLGELVKVEKQTTAKILKYLNEVDKRKLWRAEGYSSLYDYCTRKLKYSEGEASRRIQSARSLAKFPELDRVLECKELNLTTLSILSSKLTSENHKELIEESKNKSAFEVKRILATHFPETSLPTEKIKPVTQNESLIQFVADKEMEELIFEAKNILRHKFPKGMLKDIFKESLKNLIKTPKMRKAQTKSHTRYIPRRIKREVMLRDNAMCTFVGDTGTKCEAKAFLEYDHIRPYGMGGSSHDADNIRLLCSAHNQYLAETYFPKSISR
jgi:hypothetical protein